jgi:hypothetical protein
MPKKRKSAALRSGLVRKIQDGFDSGSAGDFGMSHCPGEETLEVNNKLLRIQFAPNQHCSEPTRDEPAGNQSTGRDASALNQSRLFSANIAAPDLSFSLAQAIRKKIGDALLRCEERYPIHSHRPLLYVVVRDDSLRRKQELETLVRQHSGESDAFSVEIVAKGTDELLRRLASAGLIAETIRSARQLWPTTPETFFPPLSEIELQRSAAHRRNAARKIRMASVLAEGGLDEEARMALLDAIEPLGRALAVENRLPEPECLEEALLPPLNSAWQGALTQLRAFLRNTSHPIAPVVAMLEKIQPSQSAI